MRFSIGKLMLLVAICGVNFFLLGKIGSPPETYGVDWKFGVLVLIGALPMLDVLGFLALIRTPGRRGLDGFLLGGGLALMLYLAVASLAPGPINDGSLALVNAIVPLGNRALPRLVGRLTLGVLLNLLPQIAVAYLLGRRIRAWRGRDDAPARPGPPPPERP